MSERQGVRFIGKDEVLDSAYEMFVKNKEELVWKGSKHLNDPEKIIISKDENGLYVGSENIDPSTLDKLLENTTKLLQRDNYVVMPDTGLGTYALHKMPG